VPMPLAVDRIGFQKPSSWVCKGPNERMPNDGIVLHVYRFQPLVS
jgi:hypothetical protein